MRCGYSSASLAFSCVLGTSSAALTAVTGVTASANGWDTRTTGYGCAPSGCEPANVIDDSIEPDSRWSCRPSVSEVKACELTLVFDEPHDIFEIRMALWKGNQRNRTVDIWVDGSLSTTVQSSGSTLAYEAYELFATQATTIVLQEAGAENNVWLSITGVKVMTDSEVEVSLPSPAPTSDDYVGCFSDMVGDRVLTIVATDDALIPADCAATCGETNMYFYGLQQGNECWCAGCDITDRDTNTAFDRHGDGTCSTPCSGDPTSTCGGDMSISLYQTTTCLATPAPTPAFSASGCPSGSVGASLEIIASWDDEFSSPDLHVVEPGGVEVSDQNKLGDVGIWAERREGRNGDCIARPQTYLTLNGLSEDNDAVLGDYKIWVTGGRSTTWTITARSGGELLWVNGGVFSEFQEETETFTATVTSYAESDCTVDEYGSCPQSTYGPGGLLPCSACAPGLVAFEASAYCTVPALDRLHVPETIASAMLADAVGGWAGPGYPVLDDNRYFELFVAEGAELGTVSVSGTFSREDGAALPASTALYLYMHNEGSESDFVRGEGVLDPTTGNFTATITDFPIGYSTGLLSFVVLDPADAADEYADDSVFIMDVVNEGCSDALRIKLEWDSHDDLDLWVTDPNGDRVSYSVHATGIGYVNDRNGADAIFRNPDTGFTSSFEEYVLFSGLSGDAMLGEYRIFARREYAQSAVAWKLTATIGGAVVWIEEGAFDGRVTTSQTYDDDDYEYNTYDDFNYEYNTYVDDGSIGSRRLFNPYTFTFYSSSSEPQSDVFTVTLTSYDAVGC